MCGKLAMADARWMERSRSRELISRRRSILFLRPRVRVRVRIRVRVVSRFSLSFRFRVRVFEIPTHLVRPSVPVFDVLHVL
jgi:hypothetical protein